MPRNPQKRALLAPLKTVSVTTIVTNCVGNHCCNKKHINTLKHTHTFKIEMRGDMCHVCQNGSEPVQPVGQIANALLGCNNKYYPHSVSYWT